MFSLVMFSRLSLWLFIAPLSKEQFKLLTFPDASNKPFLSSSSSLTPTSRSSSLKRYNMVKDLRVEYEVCLSPGCLADGAQSTLDQLLALAPPGLSVKPGVCCSLCGNGPVVLDEPNNKKYKRVVSGTDKVVDLILQYDQDGKGQLTPIQQAILDGYQVIAQAQKAFNQNDFSNAESLYEQGITTALDSAKDLERSWVEYELKNNKEEDKTDSPSSSPVIVTPRSGMQWLIQAYQGQARAQFKMGKIDEAVISAQKSCDLAQNLSPEALEILQEMYQAQGNNTGELSALLAYFELPEPEKMTTQISNKRRQLGFRLTKLKRELDGASS